MKKTFWAIIILSLCLFAVTMAMPVFAQDGNQTLTEEPIEPTEPETGPVIWVVAGWLLYSLLGLVASITKADGTKFDPKKFALSFLWFLIVAVVAVALKLTPVQVETQYPSLITDIVNLIANSSVGLTLIYFFDKLWKIATNIKNKFEIKTTTTSPSP